MGYAIIKGLGAPREVSSVAIDGASGRVESAEGCTVMDASAVDGGLPLNLGQFSGLKYRFIPIPDESTGTC